MLEKSSAVPLKNYFYLDWQNVGHITRSVISPGVISMGSFEDFIILEVLTFIPLCEIVSLISKSFIFRPF